MHTSPSPFKQELAETWRILYWKRTISFIWCIVNIDFSHVCLTILNYSQHCISVLKYNMCCLIWSIECFCMWNNGQVILVTEYDNSFASLPPWIYDSPLSKVLELFPNSLQKWTFKMCLHVWRAINKVSPLGKCSSIVWLGVSKVKAWSHPRNPSLWSEKGAKVNHNGNREAIRRLMKQKV